MSKTGQLSAVYDRAKRGRRERQAMTAADLRDAYAIAVRRNDWDFAATLEMELAELQESRER